MEEYFFDDKKVEKLGEMTDSLVNATMDLVTKGTKHPILTKLSQDFERFRTFIAKLGIGKDKDKTKAYYLGVWKTLYEVQKRVENYRCDQIMLQSLTSNYTHLKPFIMELYHFNVISHNDIMKKLKLKPNAFSNFISRIRSKSVFRRHY